jgi:hypothetical protein
MPEAGGARSGAPHLSVVIAVREVPGVLAETLQALERQEQFDRTEVILSDGSSGGIDPETLDRFEWLEYLRLPGRTLPILKGEALQAAQAPILAILDPYDEPEAGWVGEILAAMGPDGSGSDAVAVGGAVLRDGSDNPGNRAAYLFEYGAFSPPVSGGPTGGDLPGNNVAYRRESILGDCADLLGEEGFNKPLFHDEIRRRGGTLFIHPRMRVRHRTTYQLKPFAVRRFHYGRCFGATRFRRSRMSRRWLYRIFALTVPPLLVFRHLARTLRHPSNRRLLPSSGLALIGICLSWGLGEAIGYWLGPGRSCSKFF